MNIIKKSFTIIIWILLIALGCIILSNSASKMGGYRIEAWTYVKGLFVHSKLFWAVGILIFLQVILLNLKPFKGKTIILITSSAITIIISIMFYQDILLTMTAYKQIILDTNGIAEIGMAVFEYKKYVLIYSIISSILTSINTIQNFIVKNKGMA